MKKQNGITLIALIITIIVMLILVLVSVTVVLRGGLFNTAKDASGRTADAIKKEQQLDNGEVNVGGLVYESMNDYINNNLKMAEGWRAATDQERSTAWPTETVKNEKVTAMTDGTNTIPLPQGYQISLEEGESAISTGLVITDGENEFVWIPVSVLSQMAVPVEEGSTNYRGVLYDWNTDPTGETVYPWSATSTSNVEPAELGASYDSEEKFTEYEGGTYTSTMYQEEFNRMVASVGTYKGFYVGRYETGGFNGTRIVSKAGEGDNSINNTKWYKMYKMQKEFSNGKEGIGSTMIWGCQYDQVMKFVNGKKDGEGNTYTVTATSSIKHTGNLAETGSNKNDIVQNIYDLEGNVSEWTLEVLHSTARTWRGGFYGGSDSSATRYGGPGPMYSNRSVGSRVTLYIK